MENNLENKAKFFAQHFDSEAIWRTSELDENVDEVTWEFKNFKYLNETDYLELKPLSSITDEEMSNMANFYEKSATNIYIHDFQLTFDYYEGDETHSVAVDLDYGYCLDYLRNNGFATDWMGLSVEKLQEYGWIKLKND